MTSLRSQTALLLIAAGLAGCTSGPTGALTAANNPSLYSVNQPVVQRSDFILDLDAAGGTLSPSERARLAGWFDSIELSYGDQLFVDEPRAYPSPVARAEVARLLGEYGIALQPGTPVVGGVVAPGTIRVIASRATASVPGCPNWSEDQIKASVNTSPGYGCAVNSNLAAMVADPNDLVRGRNGNANGSGNTANRAVRVYRDRQPSGAGALPEARPAGGK